MARTDDIIVVESSVWIDLLANDVNAHTEWLKANWSKSQLSLLDLILCEVLQGVKGGKAFETTLTRLGSFEVFDTGGFDLAVAAARNYQFLRSRGVTVRGTIDCLIATFCIREGYALLHRDRDFAPFEEHLGLRVIHPPVLVVQ